MRWGLPLLAAGLLLTGCNEPTDSADASLHEMEVTISPGMVGQTDVFVPYETVPPPLAVTPESASFSEADLTVSFQGLELFPGMPLAPVLSELSLSTADGACFTADGLELSAADADGAQVIQSIRLTDSACTTQKGLRVGMTRAETLGLYGDAAEPDDTQLVYSISGKGNLTVSLKNGVVTGILLSQ